MSLTASQYLKRLLGSITNYYTATYSSDTEVYKIVQTYSNELASGSGKISEVRNDVFLSTASTSKLTPNFGTYYNQSKYFYQDYDEDRYVASSATITTTIPSSTTTNTYTIDFPWTTSTVATVNTKLKELAYYNNNLYVSSTGVGVTGGLRLHEYSPLTNTWGAKNSPAVSPIPMVIPLNGSVLPQFLWGLHEYKTSASSPPYLYMMGVTGTSKSTSANLVLYKFDGTNTTVVSPRMMTFTSVDGLSASRTILYKDSLYFIVSGRSTSMNSGYTLHPAMFSYSHGSLGQTQLYNTPLLYDYSITDAIVWDDKILISCSFSPLGDPVATFIVYDGTATFVPNLYGQQYFYDVGVASLSSLGVFENNLYACTKYVSSMLTDHVGEIIKYVPADDTWVIVRTLDPNEYVTAFEIHKNNLYASTSQGNVHRLFAGSTEWDIPYHTLTGAPIRDLKSSGENLYAIFDGNGTTGFTQTRGHQIITTTVSGSSSTETLYGWSSIPGYRKQLDFMSSAAVNGGTIKGVNDAACAFTLINSDIRELYKYPDWKLKAYSGSIQQLTSNTVRFTPAPQWFPNQWVGALGTLYSGSKITDKVTSNYVVKENTQTVININVVPGVEW